MFLSKRKLFIPNGDKLRKKSTAVANALALELIHYGYRADPEIVKRLSMHKPAKAREFAECIYKAYTAGNLNPPLFANWEARTEFTFHELVVQICGYMLRLSGNDLENPAYLDQLKDNVDYKNHKAVEIATFDEAQTFFNDLIKSSVGQNREQQETLRQFAEVFAASGYIRSDEARITVLIAKGFEFLPEMKCKPADVLRYFAGVSDITKVNLPHDVEYENLKWRERVGSLRFWSTFEPDALMEAMGHNRGAWVRFFRHSKLFKQADFIKRFPAVVTCAWVSAGNKQDALPSGLGATLKGFIASGLVEVTAEGALAYRTEASRIQAALDSGKWKKIRKALDGKNSYLLRNLATVAGAIKKKHEQDFREWVQEAVKGANPNVLFSLLQIDTKSSYRIIDVKGDTTIQPASYPEIINQIQGDIEKEVKSRYGRSGKIKTTDAVKQLAVPFLSRNQELDRGTKFAFDGKRYLYFFMHWVQKGRTTDLDHSYLFLDKGMNHIGSVSYRNQVNGFITCSGDITNAPAPNGATEYGRIDLSMIPDPVAYVVPVCNVYSGSVFSENEEAYAGFYFSDKQEYTLKRDHTRYDLNQPAQANVPFMIDMAEREIVLIDYNQRGRMSAGVEGYVTEIRKLADAIKTRNTMTIGRFAEMLSGDGVAELTIKVNPSKDDEMAPSELSKLVA